MKTSGTTLTHLSDCRAGKGVSENTGENRLTTAEIEDERHRMEEIRRTLPEPQAEAFIEEPLLAQWIISIRGEGQQEAVREAFPHWANSQGADCSDKTVIARTALILEQNLAFRDAFLLTALTELTPARLLEEALHPLDESSEEDVRDTFGRGLRSADYRQPHYLGRACQELIELQRCLPSPWAGAPLAMLSLLLWWQHKSDEALGACTLALSQRPANGLARLVATAIEANVYPQD